MPGRAWHPASVSIVRPMRLHALKLVRAARHRASRESRLADSHHLRPAPAPYVSIHLFPLNNLMRPTMPTHHSEGVSYATPSTASH